MNKKIKIILASGITLSLVLIGIGLTLRFVGENKAQNITNQALLDGKGMLELHPNYNWTRQEEVDYGLEFGNNYTMGAIQNNTLQNALANADSMVSNGNSLILAGLIGFGIVGLCCLIGYAIHKHTVALINKNRTLKRTHKRKFTKYSERLETLLQEYRLSAKARAAITGLLLNYAL